MIKNTFRVEINLEQQMCDNCIRNDKDYYEYLVQIRYPKRLIEKVNEDIEFILKTYKDLINNIKEKKNGIDIYFKKNISYNKILNKLYRNFLIENKINSKLVGLDRLRSKKKYRTTCLFKIVDLIKNDKIYFKGKLYYIKSFYKNNLILISLDNSNKKRITYSINKNFIKKIV